MGDKHFLLQNTLTGIILIIFFMIGIGISNHSAASTIIQFFLNKWQNLSALIISPIIGIVVQGVFMYFAYKKNHPYQTALRKAVANTVRNVLQPNNSIPQKIKSLLTDSPDDSIFMCILYKNTPEYIIEWGRRRRDFQHLGENWSTATIIGITFGFLTGLGLRLAFVSSTPFFIFLSLLFTFLWIFGLISLSKKMKKDVEAMEITSICVYLDPEIDEKIREQFKAAF